MADKGQEKWEEGSWSSCCGEGSGFFARMMALCCCERGDGKGEEEKEDSEEG